jgi:hypothetical protein
LDTIESGVQFTDDELGFTITVSNESDYRITGPYVDVVVAIGDGHPKPFYQETHRLHDLEPDDSKTITERIDALVLEGHAKIGIGSPSIASHDHDEKTAHLSAEYISKYDPLATFSVWDRDHYWQIHERPQQMQEVAAFTSLAVVFLAIIQVGTALGEPIVGTLVALSAAGLYYKKFGLPAYFKTD